MAALSYEQLRAAAGFGSSSQACAACGVLTTVRTIYFGHQPWGRRPRVRRCPDRRRRGGDGEPPERSGSAWRVNPRSRLCPRNRQGRTLFGGDEACRWLARRHRELSRALAGLISQWPYWWYAIPATVGIAGIAAAIALIPFAHEQVKKATTTPPPIVTPTPAPTAEPNPVTLHLSYLDREFRVYNDGNRNLFIWGTRLDGGKKSIDAKALVVSPGPVGDFIPLDSSVQQEILGKVHVGKTSQTPLTLYLKSDVGEEWIARFTLLITNKRGTVKIVTHPNDVVKHRWSDPPAPAPQADADARRTASSGFGLVQPKSYARIAQDEATKLMLGMGMKAQRQRGFGAGSSSGFGTSSPGRSEPPPAPPPKPKADPVAAARLARLARRMRNYDDSFERRSPPKPPPPTVHDPEEDDYDDMGRLVGDLAQHASEDAYNGYQARRGIFFHDRFHKEISALQSVLAPTAGKDPGLQCLVGTYALQMDRDAVLYVAEHIEKVANDLQGSE